MAETEYDDLLKKIPDIAKAVNAFTSEAVQQRALAAILGTLGVKQVDRDEGDGGAAAGGGGPRRRRRKRVTREAEDGGGDGKPTKRKTSRGAPSMVRDLNLRPKEGKSFKDFATEKAPDSAYEKNTVAVYWLRAAGITKISQDHVYTCYKEIGTWRLPGDLYHSLANTAFKKGWLDTADMSDITVSAHGENLVEHDLPHMKKEA